MNATLTKVIRDLRRDGLDRDAIESVIYSNAVWKDFRAEAIDAMLDAALQQVTVAAATPPTLTFFESIALPLVERGGSSTVLSK